MTVRHVPKLNIVGYTSVSYTHLDVYKRQRRESRVRQGGNAQQSVT